MGAAGCRANRRQRPQARGGQVPGAGRHRRAASTGPGPPGGGPRPGSAAAPGSSRARPPSASAGVAVGTQLPDTAPNARRDAGGTAGRGAETARGKGVCLPGK